MRGVSEPAKVSANFISTQETAEKNMPTDFHWKIDFDTSDFLGKYYFVIKSFA